MPGMALASRYKFSKVLPVVALNVIYARALTFENFWQACPVTTVVIIFNFLLIIYIYIEFLAGVSSHNGCY